MTAARSCRHPGRRTAPVLHPIDSRGSTRDPAKFFLAGNHRLVAGPGRWRGSSAGAGASTRNGAAGDAGPRSHGRQQPQGVAAHSSSVTDFIGYLTNGPAACGDLRTSRIARLVAPLPGCGPRTQWVAMTDMVNAIDPVPGRAAALLGSCPMLPTWARQTPSVAPTTLRGQWGGPHVPDAMGKGAVRFWSAKSKDAAGAFVPSQNVTEPLASLIPSSGVPGARSRISPRRHSLGVIHHRHGQPRPRTRCRQRGMAFCSKACRCVLNDAVTGTRRHRQRVQAAPGRHDVRCRVSVRTCVWGLVRVSGAKT